MGGLEEKAMKLVEPHFDTLGIQKTHEMRPNVPKRHNWNVGNTIIVHHQNQTKPSYSVKITEKHTFSSFEDAFQMFSVKSLLPNTFDSNGNPIETIESGIEYYRQFPNYKEDEQEYGTVVWKMERI